MKKKTSSFEKKTSSFEKKTSSFEKNIVIWKKHHVFFFFFQKHLGLKTWTAGVRAAYFRSLSSVVQSCEVSQLTSGIVKPAAKALEKAIAQHAQVSHWYFFDSIHRIYPNNTRDVYLYIYSVSAYMG